MADQTLSEQERGWVDAVQNSELSLARLEAQPAEASQGASFVRNGKESDVSPGKNRLYGLWMQIVYCRYLFGNPDNKYNEKSGPASRNFNFTGQTPSDSMNSTLMDTNKDFERLRNTAVGSFVPPANAKDKNVVVDASAIGKDGKGRMQTTHTSVQTRLEKDLMKIPGTSDNEARDEATIQRNDGFPYVIDLRGKEPPPADSTEPVQKALNRQPKASVHDLQPGQLTLSTGNLEHFPGQVSMTNKTRVWKSRMVPKNIYILKDKATEADDDDDDVGPPMEFSKRRNDGEDSSSKRQAT